MRTIGSALWPKGGWNRALNYVLTRLWRLPDSPERISRGIWAGVFVAFSPFFGLHFLLAAILALAIRGNVIASLLATFFGNPVTYVPIALVSLKVGHMILGTTPEQINRPFIDDFVQASADMWRNSVALFTTSDADWHGLAAFYHGILLPFMVGGVLIGAVAATVVYVVCLRAIYSFKERRLRTIRPSPAPSGIRGSRVRR